MSRSRTVDLRWNALLNDFRRSGLTQAEFCHRHQISLHSFRKHLYPPRPSQPAPSDDCSSASVHHPFLPVTILPDPIPSATASSSDRCSHAYGGLLRLDVFTAERTRELDDSLWFLMPPRPQLGFPVLCRRHCPREIDRKRAGK